MVHSCVVCKRVQHLSPEDVTFHSFPKDPERKNLWLELVGMSGNQPIPKYPEICSDHFFPEDLEVRGSNGYRYVKAGAKPRRCEGMIFLDKVSTSPDSTIYGTCTRNSPAFPKDPEKRKLWLGLVGISESYALTKYPELCSDHFHPDDLEVRSNGLRYVKRNVNPRRSEGLLFLDDDVSSSFSSDSTVFGTSPRKPLSTDSIILKSPPKKRLPDDSSRRKIWLSILKIDDRKKQTFICSHHFHDDDFEWVGENNSIKSLKKSAVPHRARTWAIASKRDDLLNKLDRLPKNYRLCSEHFEPKMFANKKQNRLNSDATPTLFPTMESGSGYLAINIDHPYSRSPLAYHTPKQLRRHLHSKEPSKKICDLQDEIFRPADGSSLETVQSTCTENKTPVCLAIPEISQSPELPSPSCSTQTPTTLSSNSPRKISIHKHDVPSLTARALTSSDTVILSKMVEASTQTDIVYEDTRCLSNRTQDNLLDDSVAPPRNISSPSERTHDNLLDDSVTPPRNVSSPSESFRLEDSDMHPVNQQDDIQKDEWYYFGKNISCQLSGLPLDRALVAQQKILDLFTQERIDCIINVKIEETNT